MIPWTDNVRQSGKLSIYIGGLAGTWAHVFREAIHDFNLLSKAHKLGVMAVESKEAPDGDGGANVGVQTADGLASASYGGETQSKAFGGSAMHGLTTLFYRQPGNFLEKAFIFLPTKPLKSTPTAVRPVGPGVMKLIAVHELFHACGLENSDHATALFQANPDVTFGNTPAGDKVLIGKGPQGMPPFILDGATAQKVKDLWSS